MSAVGLGERIDALRPAMVALAADEIVLAVPRQNADDPARRALMCEVLDELLVEVASALRHGTPPTRLVDSPAAQTLEQALVRDGVPVTGMVLAIQVAQRVFVQVLLRELDADEVVIADLPQALHLLAGLGEELTRDAITRFDEATALWNQSSGAGLHRRVLRVLDGSMADPATIERLLGYSMAGPHACALVWSEGRDFASHELVEAHSTLRSAPGVTAVLLVPVDERQLWCWVTLSGPIDEQQWRDGFESRGLPMRAALSSAAPGVDGFRSTHRDALAVAGVVRAAPRPKIVFHREVAAVSFLAQDRLRAREFVRRALGDLAAPTDNAARLRQTLRVHLSGGEDASATGRVLFIHRNTVTYRIGKALDLLPRPLAESRLDVALALDYEAWFPIAGE